MVLMARFTASPSRFDSCWPTGSTRRGIVNHHQKKRDNEGCASALLLVAGIILGLACLFAVVQSGGGR